MTLPDELLMAYVDGELDPVETARVAAAVAADPALAAAVDRQRRLRRRLAAAHAGSLEEPMPAALLAAARGEVASLAARRAERRRWRWPEWTAMAASLLLGVLFAQWLAPDARTPELVRGEDALLAHGALAAALDTQVAGEEGDGFVIGLSFRDADGGYCRSFVLPQARPLAGLACREGKAWRVPVLAEGEAAADSELRQAATALPLAVLQAVDERMVGEPLDAEGERAARAAGWR